MYLDKSGLNVQFQSKMVTSGSVSLKMKVISMCKNRVVSTLNNLFLHLLLKGQRRNLDECDCSSLVRQCVASKVAGPLPFQIKQITTSN